MKTEEFIQTYSGLMTENIHRNLSAYADMCTAWWNLSLSHKIRILEISGSYFNYETSIVLAYKEMLMYSVNCLGNRAAQRSVLGHIASIDKFWGKKGGKENISYVSGTLSFLNNLNSWEKYVKELLFLFPLSPKDWIERLIYYCERLRIPGSKIDNIFSFYIPNPFYEGVNYASIA